MAERGGRMSPWNFRCYIRIEVAYDKSNFWSTYFAWSASHRESLHDEKCSQIVNTSNSLAVGHKQSTIAYSKVMVSIQQVAPAAWRYSLGCNENCHPICRLMLETVARQPRAKDLSAGLASVTPSEVNAICSNFRPAEGPCKCRPLASPIALRHGLSKRFLVLGRHAYALPPCTRIAPRAFVRPRCIHIAPRIRIAPHACALHQSYSPPSDTPH